VSYYGRRFADANQDITYELSPDPQVEEDNRNKRGGRRQYITKEQKIA
jgi:hypothetical protein